MIFYSLPKRTIMQILCVWMICVTASPKKTFKPNINVRFNEILLITISPKKNY